MRILLALVAAAVFWTGGASAKGGGIGIWMEGQVSEVRAEGSSIHVVVHGRLWLEQYHGQQRSAVEVRELRDGGPTNIPATLVQANPFFAMVENWRGGSISQPGALLRILQAASASGQKVKFELLNARLKFEPDGGVAVEGAQVIRATDHALR
jgi:hypothetical protein